MRRTAKIVIAEGCRRLGVPIEDIMGPSRRQPLVTHRQELMYDVFVQCPHLTYPRIGAAFGRDHTTVMHGVRQHCRKRNIRYGQAVEERYRNGSTDPALIRISGWVNPIQLRNLVDAYSVTMRGALE